jgi:hypothetical protein
VRGSMQGLRTEDRSEGVGAGPGGMRQSAGRGTPRGGSSKVGGGDRLGHGQLAALGVLADQTANAGDFTPGARNADGDE